MDGHRAQLIEICKSCCRIECLDYQFDDLRPSRDYDHTLVSGSGFLIDAGALSCVETETRYQYVLTNFHVIDGCPHPHEVTVLFPSLGKKGIIGTVIRAFPQIDLAIIRFHRNEETNVYLPLTITSDAIPNFTRAYALGYPMASNDVMVSEGTISGWDDEHIQLNISINDGNSGGPILVEGQDGKLEVVAVTVASGSDTEGIAFGIPMLFWSLYQSCVSKRTFRKSSEILHFFPETTCSIRGSFITTGHENDILMTMGFREGDKVININGSQPVDDFGEVSVGWRPKASWLENVLLYNHIVQGGSAIVERGSVFNRRRVIIEWPPLPSVKRPPVHMIYPAYDRVTSHTIGSITLSNLTSNIIDSAIRASHFQNHLSTYLILPTKRSESAIVVTHVDVNSEMYGKKIIRVYDVITHVNGIRVHSILELVGVVAETITINDIITIECC